MYIDGLGSNNVGGSTPKTDNKDQLGRDEFLTLLITQLKNQDPLNPLQSTDFTAQLAQFTSLEQLFSMNDSLAGIQQSLDSQKSGNILDYIGKEVKTSDNTILVKDGNVDSSTYTLEDKANVTISIYNGQGMEVRRIFEGWKDAGAYGLNWDGRDQNGNMADDGIYTFEVEATNENGLTVPYHTYVDGEVTGVTYQNNIPYLMIGDKKVIPENIIEVKNPMNQ